MLLGRPARHPGWVDRTIGAVGVILSNRAIVRLQAAYLLLFGAVTMALVAQMVVAFDQAGAAGVAILTLAQMLPTVVIVPLAAAVGQRTERRRLLLASLIACSVGTGGSAALLAADGPFWLLLVLAAVLAAGAGVGWSVMTAMLPDLARDPGELVGANVAATAAEGVGGLAGPLLASIVLLVSGPEGVCVVATAGLVGGIMLAVGVRPPRVHLAVVAEERRTGVRALLGETTSGIGVLWRRPGARMVTIGAVVQTFVRGALGVLIVAVALDVLGVGDAGVGLLNAAIGLGGLAGSALTAALMIDRRLGPAFAIAIAAWGAPLVLAAPFSSMPALLLALVAVGIANAFVDVAGFGLLQGCVPDRQRTAGLGAVRALVSVGMAAGGVAASILLAWMGPLVALAVVGAILPILALVMWPRWRRLDEDLLVPRSQVAAMRACPLFAPLTLAQLEQLACGSTVVTYATGEAVIREGETGDAFYLLTEGWVEVSVADRRVSTLGPGQGFGEIALLRDSPRTATVVALAPLVAYRVDAVTFVSAVSGSAVSREAAEAAMARYVHRIPEAEAA